jgi:hypothetical protein
MQNRYFFYIDIVYIAEGASGLQIIDVSDPYFPVFLDSINPHPNSIIEKCIVHHEQLIISDTNWNELSFYNLDNPTFPKLSCRYNWNLATDDMVIQNGYLYTGNGCYGLNILDLNKIVNIEILTLVPLSTLNLRNYPNPFNPVTTISFEITKTGDVILDVFNSKDN